MAKRKDTARAGTATDSDVPGLPEQAAAGASCRLDVTVVFTSTEATIRALKKAATLAQGLNARITLVAPRVVPWSLPLDRPPVAREFNERRLRRIVRRSPVETTVYAYLCRDKLQALTMALSPHSIVVIGGRTRWLWPTREQSLASDLRRAGHEVILAA
jgi:hypothetical protein